MKTVSFDELGGQEGAPTALVTIGTFDGVHLGHQYLLRSACDRARTANLRSYVATFEPIPAAVLRPEQFPGRICSAEEKLGILDGFGFDRVIAIRFDRDLAARSPEEFMERLAAATGLRELWIGETFALGRGRSGGVEELTQIGQRLDYRVNAVGRIEDQDGVISSSRVRQAIHLGDVSLANRLLGRPFRVTGVVIHGAQFGRTIGFPTANVNPDPTQVPLADGIYASRVLLTGSHPRLAMTYVGTRPSVNTGARQIETNVLDFSGDLYDQTISVDILQRLRPDQYFPSIDALVAQLRHDEVVTREFFRGLGAETN